LAREVTIKGKLIIKELCGPERQPPKNIDLLYTHRTALPEVLVRANRDSLNLVAECLLKTLGAHYQPEGAEGFGQGTWQRGREAVRAFLQKLQVPPAEFALDDGSGLSRKNRLSARCATGVLRYMFSHEDGEMFRDSLATPTSGTLKRNNRFTESKYQGRIYAKTGYINSVWALSGYCRRQEGEWLAFSMIANKGSPSPRSAIDEIVKLIIEE